MITIRTATAHDAPAPGRLLGEGFRDDPAWAQFYPDPATRAERLTAHYRRSVRRHPERVDVATDDGRVVGALLWEPPEAAGAGAAIRRVLTQAIQSARSRLPGGRGIRHTREVDSHRPPEPHWYLHDIGAGPEARGRGVGSALLEHRLGLVDQSGTALMFLEATTPGSRRLYERFGFEAVGSVPTQPGQASTAMIRRA
ncbi:GNAT family N-acetyltransferase [uncultured Dietzia sp.]|uniref:GNAT family N-acetyltransferase n=1 Tax=uncultured Dietzia sp. TaxID=395519 RepID=UPI002614D8E2|nr:GNAT family N-acetyltransferase [uncultured Dietzia sp.]